MINESRLVDGVIVLRLLKLLSTPIENSDAFKMGIINQDGKKIKEPSGAQEMAAYTILNRFIFKIQFALMKSPDRAAKRLLTLTAAIAILREHTSAELDLYTNADIEALLDMYETDGTVIQESALLEHNTLSYKNFREEVAANSAGGGAIDGIGIGAKGEPGRDPVMMPMIRRKKKNGNK